MSNKNIKAMAESIINTHDGQAYFNYGQASKIIGCGENTVAHLFSNSGVIVKRVGPSKRVSAYDIAYVMYSGRVAPTG